MWLIQLTLPASFSSKFGFSFAKILRLGLGQLSHFCIAELRLISILYNYAAYSVNASFSSLFIRQGVALDFGVLVRILPKFLVHFFTAAFRLILKLYMMLIQLMLPFL